MGREIRRVPADWQHPLYDSGQTHPPEKKYHPLYDQDFRSAAQGWTKNFSQWFSDHPTGFDEDGYPYWEAEEMPPDREYYRERAWTATEATHFQVYETVSEGTPVTPAFASKEELIRYLVENGDYWDQRRGDGGWSEAAARRFVESEWAPSLTVKNYPGESVKIMAPRDQESLE